MPYFIKIGQTVSEIWQFNVFFQNGGRPPSWISWASIGTTRGNHLVVSIVVPNLIRNRCSSFDETLNILPVWLENAYTRLQNWVARGNFTPKMGSNINETPKGQPLRESASFEPSNVKIRRRVWPLDEFPNKTKCKVQNVEITHVTLTTPTLWTVSHRKANTSHGQPVGLYKSSGDISWSEKF